MLKDTSALNIIMIVICNSEIMKSRKEKIPHGALSQLTLSLFCVCQQTPRQILQQSKKKQLKHIIKHDIEIKLNDLINNFL